MDSASPDVNATFIIAQDKLLEENNTRKDVINQADKNTCNFKLQVE